MKIYMLLYIMHAVVIGLLGLSCASPNESTATDNLCQLDPSTGRCKVGTDVLLTRARNATASHLGVSRDEIECGPGADVGVYQCDRQVQGGVVDCVVVFTDGGLIEELHCDYLPG
jgi:hypothetical protein